MDRDTEWFLAQCERWWGRNGIPPAARQAWRGEVSRRWQDRDDALRTAVRASREDPRRFATEWMQARVPSPRATLAGLLASALVFATGMWSLMASVGVVSSPQPGLGVTSSGAFVFLLALPLYHWHLAGWSLAERWRWGTAGFLAYLALLVTLTLSPLGRGDGLQLADPVAVALVVTGAAGAVLATRRDPRRQVR